MTTASENPPDVVYGPAWDSNVQAIGASAVMGVLAVYLSYHLRPSPGQIRLLILAPFLFPIGVLFLGAAALKLVSLLKGVPRLTVVADGIRLETLFDAHWARWSSLGGFQLGHTTTERAMVTRTVITTSTWAITKIVGPGADEKLIRRGVFTLHDRFDTPIYDIVHALNERVVRARRHPQPTYWTGSVGDENPYGLAGTGRPWMTYGILFALVTVFCAEINYGVTLAGPGLRADPRTLVYFGGLTSGPVASEWTRMFTSVLLHADLSHIIGNGIALLVAGYALERLIGRAWFFTLFTLSAIGGSLMSLAFMASNTVSVGASGGIAGLYAAVLISSFRYQDGTSQRWWLQLKSWAGLIPALIPAFFADDMSHVDFASHFGGALAGALFGLFMLMSWYGDERLPGMRKFATAVAALGGLAFAGTLAITLARYVSAVAAASAAH